MYPRPSPQYLHASSADGMVSSSSSPRKKIQNPKALRQTYALPAIHQFTPVLASTTSPRSPQLAATQSCGSEQDGISPTRSLRPTAPGAPPPQSSSMTVELVSPSHQRSPRLRPQPPLPVAIAAVASRTDQDLYRYSQGTKQRMAIRPLFEQRREDEAEIARRILTSREIESSHSHHVQQQQDVVDEWNQQEQHPRSQSQSQRHSGSRRATTPVTVGEIAGIWSSSHSTSSNSSSGRPTDSNTSTGTPTPRAEIRVAEKKSGPATDQRDRDTVDQNGDETERQDELVSVRFRTPTPPSSAGPSRRHITSAGKSARSSPDTDREVGLSEDETQAPLDTTPLSTSPDASAISGGGLVQPLHAVALHEPFMEKRASKINWLLRSPSISSSSSAQPHGFSAVESATQPPLPSPPSASVCYKLLWKDTKTMPPPMASKDSATHVELCVLLGSHGKAHISIQSPSHDRNQRNHPDHQLQLQQLQDNEQEDREETCNTLLLNDADLLASTRTRPDLLVMTPKWAQWLLSRLERDARGVWFLRIQDIATMDERCVFAEDVVLSLQFPGQLPQHDQQSTDHQPRLHTVGVTIYLLGEGDAIPNGSDAGTLLVHARDRSAGAPLTEVVLTSHELTNIAQALGYFASDSSATTTEQECMRPLLRDTVFLRKAVAESKALRLALENGLHIRDESATDLQSEPFGTSGLETNRRPNSSKDAASAFSRTIAEYEAQGLSYATPEIQQLVQGNVQLAETMFLAQAYCEDGMAAALRWLQRRQAVEKYAASYVHTTTDDDYDSVAALSLSEAVRNRIEMATRAKLEEIASQSIIEDMIHDFIALECRLALHHAKSSGGYDDYYASKLQATYRMSSQRRDYQSKRHVRLRAAQLIQSLQRGILARRKYAERRVEREKYLFYGFRSSLHHTTSQLEDPRARAMELAKETERRRQTFLMQVLHGHVAQHGMPVPFRVSAELVQTLFNEYSVVVGCTATLGDAVMAVLVSSSTDQELLQASPDSKTKVKAPRLFGSSEIHAALLTALRMQYDDTYGLSSGTRYIDASEKSPTKVQLQMTTPKSDIKTTKRQSVTLVTPPVDENTPPRWLLKTSISFQRANRNRLAALRLTQKIAGQRAAHLVALDYRSLLHERFQDFNKCRAIWQDGLCARRQQTMQFDSFSVDELVQFALDRLTCAVKDWGLDPEPLFEALNLCLLHRLGRQAIAQCELAFNRFAQGVNEMHGKRNIFPLRDEIRQELEEFECLLALRCLNIASESVETVPPSELLHVLLKGNVDDEYIRHALPSVLCIASVAEKTQLAHKIIKSYANALYGEVFNAICWSCLDTAESVTVEAAQFLERLTRPEEDQEASATIAARALYLLTGSQALRFLQFLAKVAHFNAPLQRRVLEHLAPFARDAELYRFASVVCSLDSFAVVTRLFEAGFEARAVSNATRFWVQYGVLYGEERAELARSTCLVAAGNADEQGEEITTGISTATTTIMATAPPELGDDGERHAAR